MKQEGMKGVGDIALCLWSVEVKETKRKERKEKELSVESLGCELNHG
jgi:hypothetical protein